MSNLYSVSIIRTTREEYEVYASDEIEAEDIAMDVAKDSSEDALEVETVEFFVDEKELIESDGTGE
jgi:hypothetical protein